jgi:hypothetical protein
MRPIPWRRRSVKFHTAYEITAGEIALIIQSGAVASMNAPMLLSWERCVRMCVDRAIDQLLLASPEVCKCRLEVLALILLLLWKWGQFARATIIRTLCLYVSYTGTNQFKVRQVCIDPQRRRCGLQSTRGGVQQHQLAYRDCAVGYLDGIKRPHDGSLDTIKTVLLSRTLMASRRRDHWDLRLIKILKPRRWIRSRPSPNKTTTYEYPF